MRVQSFIDKKASQLMYYIRAYWYDNLPYTEVENFMWDTLEEWAHLKHKQNEVYTHKERIFWHLMHQTQFVSKETLLNDEVVKQEVALCFEYLNNNRPCPIDVVGMRP